MMRWLALAFAVIVGSVIVVAAARFGYKTSDSEADGFMAAFLYASITIGGLLGHPLAVRVGRKHRGAGFMIGLICFCALLISLSNSLGALAGRGNETTAKRMKTAETAREINRSINAAVEERKGLRFTPTSAEAVAAARAKATAATAAKEAECQKRGDRCRAKEADEAKALEALETVTAQKSITDRAQKLDADIASLRAELKNSGPVLDVNPQGSAFARLLNLPEDAASKLMSWQQLAMVIMVEILIVVALVAFELLREEPQLKIEPAEDKRKDPEEIHEIVEGPKTFASPPKPKLIASSAEPFGSVPAIMAGLIEPGNPRDKAELADLYKAYAQTCRQH
jgi:hypothetical protein